LNRDAVRIADHQFLDVASGARRMLHLAFDAVGGERLINRSAREAAHGIPKKRWYHSTVLLTSLAKNAM
jgi:hypothetical protein